MITFFLLLFLLGIITGFYSGLIGTGGNIILIPALDFLFLSYNLDGSESVKYIISHSLFITIFLGFAVSLKQHRIGNFYFKEVMTIGLPGMTTAYLLSEWIKESDWYDKDFFDIIFLFALVILAVRLLFVNPKTKEVAVLKDINRLYLIFVGLLTGCVTSLSGLGGGIVLIPFLTDIIKIPIKNASSISIGVIMLLATAVSFSYLMTDSTSLVTQLPWQVGYISFYIVLPIMAGIFIASRIGVKVAQKTASSRLRLIFGIIVMLLIVKMVIDLIG